MTMDDFGAALASLGLRDVDPGVIDAWTRGQGGGGAMDNDPLLVAISALPEGWLAELVHLAQSCSSHTGFKQALAACGIEDRHLLAFVVAIQTCAKPMALDAFRLHLAHATHFKLYAPVLASFESSAPALCDGCADRATSICADIACALASGLKPCAEDVTALTAALAGLPVADREDSRAAAEHALEELLAVDAPHTIKGLLPCVRAAHTPLLNVAVDALCKALADRVVDDATLSASQALMQHAVISTADRADARAAVARAMCRVALCLPEQPQARYVAFVDRLSRNPKASLRQAALEGASCLWRALDADATDARERMAMVVVNGARDKAAQIRARALGAITAALNAAAPPDVATVGPSSPSHPPPASHLSSLVRAATASPGALSATVASRLASPAVDGLARLILVRCQDSKATVRRAAAVAIGLIVTRLVVDDGVQARSDGLFDAGCQLLEALCRDPSPAVRRAGAQALTLVLGRAVPHADGAAESRVRRLMRSWLSAAVPLAWDTETSVQTAGRQMVRHAFLDALEEAGGAAADMLIDEAAQPSCAAPLRRALAALVKAGAVPPASTAALVRRAASAATAPAADLAWDLLQEVTASAAIAANVDVNAVVAARSERWTGPLGTLANLAQHGLLDAKVAKVLLDEARARLCPEALDAASALRRGLVRAVAAFAEAAGEALAPVLDVAMEAAAAVLARSEASTTGADAPDTVGVSWALLVAGDVAMAAPGRVADAPVRAMQLIAIGSAVERPDAGARAPSAFPGAVQAEAMLALGRVCTGDVSRAKQLVPLFVRELRASPLAAVRNNALFVLADLVKQHAVRAGVRRAAVRSVAAPGVTLHRPHRTRSNPLRFPPLGPAPLSPHAVHCREVLAPARRGHGRPGGSSALPRCRAGVPPRAQRLCQVEALALLLACARRQ